MQLTAGSVQAEQKFCLSQMQEDTALLIVAYVTFNFQVALNNTGIFTPVSIFLELLRSDCKTG